MHRQQSPSPESNPNTVPDHNPRNFSNWVHGMTCSGQSQLRWGSTAGLFDARALDQVYGTSDQSKRGMIRTNPLPPIFELEASQRTQFCSSSGLSGIQPTPSHMQKCAVSALQECVILEMEMTSDLPQSHHGNRMTTQASHDDKGKRQTGITGPSQAIQVRTVIPNTNGLLDPTMDILGGDVAVITTCAPVGTIPYRIQGFGVVEHDFENPHQYQCQSHRNCDDGQSGDDREGTRKWLYDVVEFLDHVLHITHKLDCPGGQFYLLKKAAHL